MKILKLLGWILLIGLAGIQFFPARTNQGINGTANDFIIRYKVPDNVDRLLTSACYNCHSNHTEYPWYSRIQPVGWFIGNHIQEGKEELNLGEFGSYSVRRQKNKLESMADQIERNEMPLPSYRLMHSEARLSEQEKQALASWLRKLKENL
jgi:hypothetical protein